MTYRELLALMGNRNRRRVHGSTVIAIKEPGNPSILVVKLFRRREYPLLRYTPDGKITLVLDPVGHLHYNAFRDPINETLLPQRSFYIFVPARWYVPMWRRVPPLNSDASPYEQVLVPVTTGDAIDSDANYLHAACRYNI